MNAIIMAAGTSSRFAPLSYEKPKGLLKVKGEILIERQIHQLQEAGITDITVVVGYMAELFEYLKDKYGVKLVLNEDYNRYNNTSSIIRVIDLLEDTFICSSDNYFPYNVFLGSTKDSYYSALYADGETGEYCLTIDDKDNIIDVKVGGANSWYMVGHVFFNNDFSKKFREIMKKEYDRGETRLGYWEDVYARYIKELPPMKIHRYQPHDIEEFDSLEELRQFDEEYINNTGCSVFHNICDVLKCEEKDITDIVILKNGMTNASFAFTSKKDDRKYVYRHPGAGTEEFISRDSEYFSMQVAKKYQLDKTFVYMHPTDGWKISYFVENARILDYHDEIEMSQAMQLLSDLHKANVQSEFPYRLWDSATDFLHKIQKLHKDDTSDFYKLHDKIEKLYKYVQKDEWPECLNHCDALAANFLIGDDGDMTLIDWEYSGQGDTAQDLGSFIACSDLTYEEALSAIGMYLGHAPSDNELRHYLAYTAIASYCWYLWAIFQEANAVDTGDFLKLWHDYAYLYFNKAIALYEKQGMTTAVILAARQERDSDTPYPLIPFDGENNLIDRTISILRDLDYTDIIIVAGYKSELFEKYKSSDVTVVVNKDYEFTGSMASLAMVKNYIKEDFLLLEGDTFYERKVLEQLTTTRHPICFTVTEETGSGDECYVELKAGFVVNLTKDRHRVCRIEGEMIGATKLSRQTYGAMVSLYSESSNPLLSYEYLLMDVTDVLDRPYISFTNLIWGDVDSQEDFKRLKNVIYRKLCRKENPYDKENLLMHLVDIFPDEDVSKAAISQIGGMSNKNFRVDFNGKSYVLRVPGNGSDGMVDRSFEEFNSIEGSKLGINPPIVYFNSKSGIKLVDYVEDAETLNSATIQRHENMKIIAAIYRNLHYSHVRLKNEFNIFREIEKYDVLLSKVRATMYDGWEDVRERVMALEVRLNQLGVDLHPCHNDAVPENFIKSKNGTIYLIDWEYSGMNDPMADFAALFLESGFSPENQDFVLAQYFGGSIPHNVYEKILCYQILWDYLWAQWTVIKEAKGDDFGTYGRDRYQRAINLLENI